MKLPTNSGITGLGLYLPDDIRRNDAWPQSFVRAFHEQREMRNGDDFTHIERSAGARPYDELIRKHAMPHDGDPFKGAIERRIAPSEMPTAECDARAVSLALRDGGVDPNDVDLIFSSALVPDRIAPSNGPAIAHLTGCMNAAGFGVEGFCGSAVAQLDLACAMIESGRARNVVCVQSHIASRINDLDGPVSPIFGDASAAFVVSRVAEHRGLIDVVRGGDGALAGAVTYRSKQRPGATWYRDMAGPLVPGSDDPAAARHVARHALAYPIDTITALYTKAELPIDAVACVATIQPLRWYQAAIAEGLGISANRLPTTYSALGHVGGAAIVANLLEARRQGMLRDGSLAVLYAHGAGLTRYAALVRWAGAR